MALCAENQTHLLKLIGKGINGNVRGKVITLGNQRFLDEKGIAISQYARMKAQEFEEKGNTALFLSVDSEASGIIAVSDVRENFADVHIVVAIFLFISAGCAFGSFLYAILSPDKNYQTIN